MIQIRFPPLDKDVERQRALAKIYSLLIKLAETKESTALEIDHDEATPAPLKNNIPPQDRV